MNDDLYEHFYDPTREFAKEPRAFCYDLSRKLIDKAKNQCQKGWYMHEKTIDAILLLLFCWNFAALITKKLKRQDIRSLLKKTKGKLVILDSKTITSFDEQDEKTVADIYEEFRKTLGQTGASKALSLLNEKLFVIWDTGIRARLKKSIMRGIDNGQESRHYVKFLKETKNVIEKYGLGKKIPQGTYIAKKIDEYNYVEIIMKSR